MNRKFQMTTLIFAALAVAALFLSHSQNGIVRAAADEETKTGIAGMKTGETTTVYLRGDASGVAFSDRVPAAGNLISRTGKILSIENGWVVLESEKTRTAIPRESIAMIESGAAAAAK